MKQRGFTLIELVIVVAIVGILASGALPLARWSVKRSNEYALQQNLRIIRNAIDRYHDAALEGLIEVPEGTRARCRLSCRPCPTSTGPPGPVSRVVSAASRRAARLALPVPSDLPGRGPRQASHGRALQAQPRALTGPA